MQIKCAVCGQFHRFRLRDLLDFRFWPARYTTSRRGYGMSRFRALIYSVTWH